MFYATQAHWKYQQGSISVKRCFKVKCTVSGAKSAGERKSGNILLFWFCAFCSIWK